MSRSACPVALASLLSAGTALLAGCGTTNDFGDAGSRDSPELFARRYDGVRQGTRATDPAVVALVARRESCDAAPTLVNCTGTLIAERAVLTAAHCVQTPARGSYEVFFGASPAAAGGSYRGIAGQVVDALYDKQSDEHDIAIVWLDAPAPVAPATLATAGVIDAAWVGRAARVVGFGDALDDAAMLGEKLEGSVRISRVDANTMTYGPAPGMTCRGDSGGPVFVEQDGGEVVAALTTSGDFLCERTGVAVRTDARLPDFIAPALAAGAPLAAPSIPPDAVCTAVCASDADCPSDLACRADLDGANRCQVPSLFAGDFGASCTQAAECGEGARCVPLAGACRCEQACVQTPMESDGTVEPLAPRVRDGGSCRASPSGRAPASTAFGLVLLAVWTRRRRSATLSGARPPRRYCGRRAEMSASVRERLSSHG